MRECIGIEKSSSSFNRDGGEGSGRKPEGSSGNILMNAQKMRANPIPKALKNKWQKSGGVNNPEYKAWIKKNWT
jgi:hypothetical protein